MSTPSAVWTVRYTTGEGYDATLTLSGDDVRQVMQEARQVLYDLARLARAPVATAPTNGNGTHGEASPTTPAAAAATNGNGNPARLDWCPIHNCQMTRRESNGQAWYSHMTAAGGWCRGKAPKAATP